LLWKIIFKSSKNNKKQKHLVIRSLKLSFSPVQDVLFFQAILKNCRKKIFYVKKFVFIKKKPTFTKY